MPWTESRESPTPTGVLGRAMIRSGFGFPVCKWDSWALPASAGSGERSGRFGMNGAQGQRSHGQNLGMARGRGKGTREKVGRPASLSEPRPVLRR